ncbi:hypothetical protein ACHAW6_004323, partial [Cyclotella cf. meneghiniana]
MNHPKPTISSKPTRPYINNGKTPRSFMSTGTSLTMRHLASLKLPSAATVASSTPLRTFTDTTMPNSHVIAILSGVDKSFPINEWDSLLPQAILTLNLLRNANAAPKISAYAYHHSPFDYNRLPLVPIGCAVQVHVKPSCQCTWGKHSTDGWYI